MHSGAYGSVHTARRMRQGAYSTVHAARCTRHGANSTANMAAAYCTRCMWHDACDDAWGRAHAAPCMQHGACGTMHAIRYIRAAHAARRMRHGACGMAHAVRYMRHGEDGMVHAARRIRHGACGKVHAARCMRHGVYGTVHGCGTAHAARCMAARRMRHGAFSAMHMARRICHGTYRAVYTSRCIRPGAYGPVHRQTDDCQTGQATAKGKADLPLQSQVMGRPGGNKGDGLDGSPGSQLARAGSCNGIEAGLGSRPATSAFCTWPLLSSERAMAPVARRGITYCARLRVEDKRMEAKRLLL